MTNDSLMHHGISVLKHMFRAKAGWCFLEMSHRTWIQITVETCEMPDSRWTPSVLSFALLLASLLLPAENGIVYTLRKFWRYNNVNLATSVFWQTTAHFTRNTKLVGQGCPWLNPAGTQFLPSPCDSVIPYWKGQPEFDLWDTRSINKNLEECKNQAGVK